MIRLLFLFYVAALIAFNVWLAIKPRLVTESLDRRAYILFSLLVLGFATFRPFGVALDDYGYYMKYDTLCPVADCHLWVQSQRDFLWYSLVALLLSVHHSPEVMLWLAGFGLFLKLCVIYGLSRNKCLALLVYVSIFYLTDDVTALRIAFATGVFFVAFWLLVIGSGWLAAPLMLGLGLIHVQALAAPVLLLSRLAPCGKRFMLLAILLPLSFLILGVVPNREFFSNLIQYTERSSWLSLFFDPAQIPAIVKGVLGSIRPEAKLYPIVAPIVLLAAMIPMVRLYKQPTPLVVYSSFSLIISAWVLWGLSFNETVQFRLFSFFLTPIVFIAGTANAGKLRFPLFILVSLMYLAKYNIMHNLLMDRYHLTVLKTGDGVVKSAGPTIDCGKVCELDWGRTGIGFNQLPLYAIPAPGYRIDMGGDCGVSPNICYLKMDQDRVAVIDFIKTHLLSASRSGQGQIVAVGGGLRCGEQCNYRFDAGRQVKLLARPEQGYRFDGWLGACQGLQPECVVQMSSDLQVGARFSQTQKVKVSRVGAGKIISTDGMVDCGKKCAVIYDLGSSVTLNALPDQGSRFEGWSGACTGNEPVCNLAIRADIEITGIFVALPSESILPPNQ